MNEKNNETIKKIYEYDNYRKFLKDYFEEQKKARKKFTQRYFAQKAGFSAHNYCARVVDSKRNLSYNAVQKIIKALEISGKKAKFFENLVLYNQAESFEDKERYHAILNGFKKSVQLEDLTRQQFRFYEEWYYPVIRELLVFGDWQGDYQKLAKLIYPPITAKDAQSAVETLLQMELVKKDAEGKFLLKKDFTTAVSVPEFFKRKYRRDILKNGTLAADDIPKERRETIISTFSIGKTDYEKIKNIIDKASDDILDTVSSSEDKKNAVYNVVFNLFPASNSTPISTPKKEKE